jgi:hypothetical protein
MSRKTTQSKKRLGDTRYIFENYSEWIQLKNEFLYEADQFLHSNERMRDLVFKLLEFKPKVKIEPA